MVVTLVLRQHYAVPTVHSNGVSSVQHVSVFNNATCYSIQFCQIISSFNMSVLVSCLRVCAS